MNEDRNHLRLCFAVLVVLAVHPAVAQPSASSTGEHVPCIDGMAGSFACSSVDMLAHLAMSDLYPLGADPFDKQLNDIWGWTDPQTGREYALVGRSDAVIIIDITDPVNPFIVGIMPSHNGEASWWRDIKTYKDHAFVVVDNDGANGVQVFDLTQVRGVQKRPIELTETAHYDGISWAHNIAINEETGYAYVTGGRTTGEPCAGLYMIDIREPRQPVYAGCFVDASTGRTLSGYTHDAQCVLYRGPDADYAGREICIGANETAISIADVTDKSAPVAISVATYPGVVYAHQGWLTEDHRYYIQNDELDEDGDDTFRPRTLFWDVGDLDDPVLIGDFYNDVASTDHNLYVIGDHVYQANYTAGLRILDITDINAPREVGYFDTDPVDGVGYDTGAWSAWPFFGSDKIIVTSQYDGFFVLRQLSPPRSVENLTVTAAGSITLAVSWDPPADSGSSSVIGYDVQFGLPGQSSTVLPHMGAVTHATITDLTPNTEYVVAVAAINSEGTGLYAEATGTTSLFSVPGLVGNLTVTGTTTTSLTVSWDAPMETGGADITGYDVQYALPGQSTTVFPHSSTETQATITGLAPGTKYAVAVAAINSEGTGLYAEATSTTTIGTPGPVGNLTVSAAGPSSLTVSWDPPTETGGADITGYSVQYRLPGESWMEASLAGTTSTTISDLIAGSTYEVRVAAINTVGTGAYAKGTATTGAALGLVGSVENQIWVRGHANADLILPEATGGAPPYTYAVTPALPAGLIFDNASRIIRGTPTEVVGSTEYTYLAMDSLASTVRVTFRITVILNTASEERTELPVDLSLHGNYPNPFRTATRIVIDLPEQADVHVEVADILGRVVYTSPVRRASAGWDHSLPLDLSARTSGLYIYRVIAKTTSGTLVKTGRMLQVR